MLRLFKNNYSLCIRSISRNVKGIFITLQTQFMTTEIMFGYFLESSLIFYSPQSCLNFSYNWNILSWHLLFPSWSSVLVAFKFADAIPSERSEFINRLVVIRHLYHQVIDFCHLVKNPPFFSYNPLLLLLNKAILHC